LSHISPSPFCFAIATDINEESLKIERNYTGRTKFALLSVVSPSFTALPYFVTTRTFEFTKTGILFTKFTRHHGCDMRPISEVVKIFFFCLFFFLRTGILLHSKIEERKKEALFLLVCLRHGVRSVFFYCTFSRFYGPTISLFI
jgi:hypothetical protein